MRFDTSLIVALLPTLCLGAVSYGPGSTKGGASQGVSMMSTNTLDDDGTPLVNDHAGRPVGTNDCGTSSFLPITLAKESDKPKVSDCQELQARVLPGEHEWVVPKKGREVVRYKTCGFFSKARDDPGVIGNGDVYDLLLDSIAKFGSSGYMEVKGEYDMYVSTTGGMACDNPDHTKGVAVKLYWNISKTNKK